MEVSTMFYICRYCVFTWDGRIESKQCKNVPFDQSEVVFTTFLINPIVCFFITDRIGGRLYTKEMKARDGVEFYDFGWQWVSR